MSVASRCLIAQETLTLEPVLLLDSGSFIGLLFFCCTFYEYFYLAFRLALNLQKHHSYFLFTVRNEYSILNILTSWFNSCA